MCGRLIDKNINKAALVVRTISISTTRRTLMRIIPSTIKSKLFNIISDAEAHIDEFVLNPGKDMTRHRDCTFSDTILTIMNFSMNRLNTELFHFFADKSKSIPSKSALCQQRKKLNGKLFPHLMKSFYDAFPTSNKYKGYTLIAVDGTDINLPTDRRDEIYRVKQARSDNYFFQMHLNVLYNICDNRFHSIITQPRPQMNEQAAFCQLVDNGDFDEKTIFIADRGYVSLNTLAHLTERKKLFLIRAKKPETTASLLYKLIYTEHETDQSITVSVTRSKRNINKYKLSCYKIVRKSRVFEPIPVGDYDTVYRLPLRVVCIQLDSGTYEYLITNLPADKFTASDLKTLYHMRWNIETSFRNLKYALALVYLHSVNRDFIIQEIYAKLILYNFASLLHRYAEKAKRAPKGKNKYSYKISFIDTVPVAQMLLKRKISNKIIKALLLKHMTAIRDKVSWPRSVRSQSVKPLNSRA